MIDIPRSLLRREKSRKGSSPSRWKKLIHPSLTWKGSPLKFIRRLMPATICELWRLNLMTVRAWSISSLTSPQSETPTLDKAGNPSPLSWSIFADDLYATCSPGVKFDYSSTTGTSYYTLRWNGGQTGNSKTCSGAQCNYIISTNWSDHYTYADVQIPSPALVWGPSNAYRCK